MTPEQARDAVDVHALRLETPACSRAVHLNAAGAALLARPVVDALRVHLDLEVELGGYEAQRHAAHLLARSYAAVAGLLRADPGEVAFCDSGSRAWADAVSAIPFGAGDIALITETEYAGNHAVLRRLAARVGFEIRVVPHDADGTLDVERLGAAIDDRTRLVSVVHIPTNNGVVNAVEAIGRLDRKRAFLLVDACQSLGQLPVDVREIQCDLLVATGRKYLRAPRGTAALFVSREALPRLRPAGAGEGTAIRDSPYGPLHPLEAWESNVAAKIGMGVAAEYLSRLGIEVVRALVADRAERLRERLQGTDGVRVLDLGAGARGGLVTFVVEGTETGQAWERLADAGFALDTCDIAGTLLGRFWPGIDRALRASVHYYTSGEEIESFVGTVATLGRGARPPSFSDAAGRG